MSAPGWRALFPHAPHYATIGGQRIHFVDEGPRADHAVVCVHGNPTWSFAFRRLIGPVSTRRRIVALDHVGCGLSDKPAPGDYSYTLARRIEDLGRWLDALGLAKVDLVAHDWGGAIALGWATAQPERVGRLVLANTAAFHPEPPGRAPWLLHVARAPILGATLVRGLGLFSRGAVRWCTTRRPLSAAERAGYLAPYGSWAERVAVHQFVLDIPLAPAAPAWPVLAEIERRLERLAGHPALVVWGRRDFVFTPDFLAKWRRIWPGAAVLELADAGHLVLDDAPDATIERVVRFLCDDAGDSAHG